MLSVSENPDPQSPKLAHRHLVDRHHHHHHHDPHLDLSNPPHPNFSIREYVFTSRSKDIKTNWPFSLKNLQLCLKHGVKDVLPPFQALDAIRTQVFQSPLVDENNPQSHVIVDGSNPVSVESLDNSNNNTAQLTNSCKSGESNLFASTTTTSVCQSVVEELVPTANVETSSNPNKARGAGKNKCKLIVKFGSNNSDRISSAEDIASNCTIQSEAMASKICPVCKTFSSSSNTTLNAHIDQCLSVESSTPKWTIDSKVGSTRHRVKPRKTRLMVDIYSTALPCTLEDLDRRNGTNWASKAPNSDDLAAEEEEKEQRASSSVPVDEDNDDADEDVGSVYIDSNGIKLRILSKPSDDAALQVTKLVKHLRPRKPFKGTKFLSARKKKRRASQFTRYLKLAQTKKLLSSKNRSSQVSEKGQEIKHGEESFEAVQKQANIASSSGTLRQWACSKRTGVAKKLNNKVRQKRNWNVSSQDRLTNNNSSLVQNHGKDVLSENPVSEALDSLLVERSPVTTEPWSSGSVVNALARKERAFTNDEDDDNDYHMLIPSAVSTLVSVPNDNCDLQPCVRTRGGLSARPKATNVSSVGKDMPSSRRTPITEPISDVSHKFSDLQKSSGVHLRSDDEIVPWDSGLVQRRPYDLVNSFAPNQRSATQQRDSPVRNSNTGQEELPFQYHHLPHENIVPHVDQDMFYGVHSNIGASVEDGDGTNINNNNNSFAQVDPIPIPGPPGSFLPSPRDMGGSEDFQGNSSLTTSRVHSSQDHPYDLVDGDSSDSPVSATSTISNSTAKQTHGSVDSPLGNAPLGGGRSDERVYRVDNKTPLDFNEPCRCQRKERASATANELVSVSNSQASRSDTRSGDIYFSRPERLVLPAPSHRAWRGGPTGTTDHRLDLVSPSTPSSNSVLRLMGKNLMVVNPDPDRYPMPAWQQPQLQPQPQLTANSVSVPNVPIPIQQQQHQGFHHSYHNPNGFNSFHQGAMGYSFPNHHMGSNNYGGFAVPLEPSTVQRRMLPSSNNNNHRPIVGAPVDCSRVYINNNNNNNNKEIITIDDSPETERTHFFGSRSDSQSLVQNSGLRQANGSCTLDGFGVVQQGGHFIPASQSGSRDHLRSSLYNYRSSLL